MDLKSGKNIALGVNDTLGVCCLPRFNKKEDVIKHQQQPETTAIKDKQKEMIQLLSKAFYLNKNIDALKLVLQMNKSLAEKCTANYNNDGASKSISDKNGQEDIIHQVIDLSNKINEQINEMIKSRNEIADLINKSKVAEHLAILSRRYLLYQTMEQIADEMYYSSKTIQRKHKSAIEELVSLYVL